MQIASPNRSIRVTLRISLHLLCLTPALYMAWGAVTGDLGINPVETLTHFSGQWALRFLLLCLAITPLNWLLSAPWLVSYRRALGDWAFFYTCFHLGVYMLFDAQFDPGYIFTDVLERPYITIGAVGFLLLLPLAITSNQWSQRVLRRNWVRLHKLIYPAAIAVCIHFIWLVKGFQIEPLIYAAMLATLLSVRVVKHSKTS